MSANQVAIKCNEIEARFNELNMTSNEFYEAFSKWASEKAHEAVTERYRRNEKIQVILDFAMAGIISFSGIAAIVVSMVC